MIIRIVRMHFKNTEVENFLELFERNKVAIRNFAGCSHLELLKDTKDPLTYSTLSYWDSLESLEIYRTSDLFKGVWSVTRTYFSRQAEAFSLEQFIKL